jgi:hypothetical protein
MSTEEARRLHILTWRAKAAELRAVADGMTNPHTQHLLRNAAANYARMADEEEARDRLERSRSTLIRAADQ